MRQLYTFVITLFLDDQDPSLFSGRVCSIDGGEEMTFAGVEELIASIRREPGTLEQAQHGENTGAVKATDSD